MIRNSSNSIVSGLAVELFDSIDRIDAAEWNALTAGNALVSHAWLRTLEECAAVPARRVYLVARGTAGLAGAIAARVEESPEIARNLHQVVFGRLAGLAWKLRLRALPALVCGAVDCPDAVVLLRPGLAAGERAMVRQQLVESAENLAHANGWTLCFRSVAANESELAVLLERRGYLRGAELAFNYLDLPYASFREYRAALRRVHPATEKNIRGEINRGRRHGLVIERLGDPQPHYAELYLIVNAHYTRLSHEPFPYLPNFFERMRANLGDQASIYAAWLEGRMAGSYCRFSAGETAYLAIAGIDHEAGRKAAVYFNLIYNRAIENAIADGFRGIHFGRQFNGLKARRGCVQIPSDFHLRGRNRIHHGLLAGLLPLQSALVERKDRRRGKP